MTNNESKLGMTNDESKPGMTDLGDHSRAIESSHKSFLKEVIWLSL